MCIPLTSITRIRKTPAFTRTIEVLLFSDRFPEYGQVKAESADKHGKVVVAAAVSCHCALIAIPMAVNRFHMPIGKLKSNS